MQKTLEKIRQAKKIPTTRKNYTYTLTHLYDIDDNIVKWVVNAPYNEYVFGILCAYIQYEHSEVDEMDYGMSQKEVIETLIKFYGCDENTYTSPDVVGVEIDLYCNWEEFCGKGIQEIECLKREGLTEHLQVYVDNYYGWLKENDDK